MRLVWGSATHPGRVRTVNQDATLAGPRIFAVADGMGGHAAGEVASALAVAALAALEDRDPLVRADVVEALSTADAHILAAAEEDPDRAGMGTTVAGVADCEEGLVVFSIGDSRVYRVRAGHLAQLTSDDSVTADLVRRGELLEEDAATHPQRHVLTRAVGLGLADDAPVATEQGRTGDRYLVCSDGLVRELDDATLREELVRGTDAVRLAQRLLDDAIAAGAEDNVSVIVVDVLAAPADEVTVPSSAGGSTPNDAGATADALDVTVPPGRRGGA